MLETPETIRSRVKAAVDRAELESMMIELINIPSPTGNEGELGHYLAERFARLGMKVELQEIEAGRNNVICKLGEQAQVSTVMFNGHMDTSVPRGTVRAWKEGDWIFGPGASNMKSAFPAYYMAIKAIQKAGIKLAGSVLVTAVVGEIEGAPVDEFRGSKGGGIGSMLLAQRGIAADYCIIGEPTGMRVQIGNLGYALAKFATKGKRAHMRERELGISAIDNAIKLKQAIEEWEIRYQESHPHPFMKPRLNVGAMVGGNPHAPGGVPTLCNIYMSIGVLPGQKPADLLRELSQSVSHLKDEEGNPLASVDIFWFRRGYELPLEHKFATTLEAVHKDVLGIPSVFPEPYRFCVSSDCAFFYENGIPSLTYGPGGINRKGQYTNFDYVAEAEPISLKNLEECSKVYALTLLELCGVA